VVEEVVEVMPQHLLVKVVEHQVDLVEEDVGKLVPQGLVILHQYLHHKEILVVLV
jgi:hypothetical protein